MPRSTDTTLAHRARSERSEILLQIEKGTRQIVDVIQNPPDALKSADLYPVLMRVPKLGRKGVEDCCIRARIWPHRRLGELTKYEQKSLIVCLPERVTGV